MQVIPTAEQQTRQYGREDVDYATFYTPWMQSLALNHTREELERMALMKSAESHRGAASHLRAIQKSSSMQGNSSTRAQTRNVMAAAGDAVYAARGALEIHDLFPEFAKRQERPEIAVQKDLGLTPPPSSGPGRR